MGKRNRQAARSESDVTEETLLEEMDQLSEPRSLSDSSQTDDEAESIGDVPEADDADQTSAPLPLESDMEAAAEEDIAGVAQGVSRRNPDLASASQTTAMAQPLFASNYGTQRPARSGAEEADWFNRFRERLMGAESVHIAGDYTQISQEQAAKDPDDPVEDEALSYSEEG